MQSPAVIPASERQKILLAAAGVIALFGVTDVTILHRLSLGCLGVRAAWVATALWVAWGTERWSARSIELGFIAMGFISGAAFVALAQLTGGPTSPLFHFILAGPLTIAVVLQDHTRATLAAGVTTVVGGVAMLLLDGAVTTAIPWAVQAAGMAALATYASHVYARLRARAADRDREREARQRAEALVEQRDVFITAASHELKTPLTALGLQVRIIERELTQADRAPPGAVAGRLRSVERYVMQLARLIEAMLDVSLFAAGRVGLEAAPCDAVEVLGASLEALEPLIGQGTSRVEVVAPASLPAVLDRVRFGQVVTNLVGNALKYGDGKPVNVELASHAEELVLTVRDQGIGIPEADQARIFGRFERAVSPTHYSGLGVGLWLVAQIVEAHRGRVEVKSAPGAGTTFTVLLPLRPAATQTAPAQG